MKYIYFNDVRDFFEKVLLKAGSNKEVAFAVADGLAQTGLRGVDSHGLQLFPHYVKVLEHGRINGNPNYQIIKTSKGTAKLDADHTFGHASGKKGMELAINLAKENGIGSVGVYNSSHFGAAACFGLIAAENKMIGLSFTHATPIVIPYNGIKPFVGTNPICFTAPMSDEEPFCLDMSTTTFTWNKIKIYKNTNKILPEGVAYDQYGQFTTDPKKASSLASIGTYKGFGLSIMVDILCGLLTGMPVGNMISDMYDNDPSEKRFLGQFYMAIDISTFVNLEDFMKRLKTYADLLRAEPSRNAEMPLMFPGDPEKKLKIKRAQSGIPVEDYLEEQFNTISVKYDVPVKYIL